LKKPSEKLELEMENSNLEKLLKKLQKLVET
jgi:hypothetical protein